MLPKYKIFIVLNKDIKILCRTIINRRKTMRKLSLVLASLLAVVFTFATLPAKAGSHVVEACLITKTDINPFFVKMKEGAEKRASEMGVKLSFFAGKVDGDHETQVRAVETCIAS